MMKKNKPYFTKLVNQLNKIDEEISVLKKEKEVLLEKFKIHCAHLTLIESGGYDISSWDNPHKYTPYRIHCNDCGKLWIEDGADNPEFYDIRTNAKWYKSCKDIINPRFKYLIDGSWR